MHALFRHRTPKYSTVTCMQNRIIQKNALKPRYIDLHTYENVHFQSNDNFYAANVITDRKVDSHLTASGEGKPFKHAVPCSTQSHTWIIIPNTWWCIKHDVLLLISLSLLVTAIFFFFYSNKGTPALSRCRCFHFSRNSSVISSQWSQ